MDTPDVLIVIAGILLWFIGGPLIVFGLPMAVSWLLTLIVPGWEFNPPPTPGLLDCIACPGFPCVVCSVLTAEYQEENPKEFRRLHKRFNCPDPGNL